MVGLGAFVELSKTIKDEYMEKGIDWALPSHRKKMLDMNLKAFHMGKDAASKSG
jgi:Pyruvate/2-oxoacid:ferredoxin oxidoreductase gamma subunit